MCSVISALLNNFFNRTYYQLQCSVCTVHYVCEHKYVILRSIYVNHLYKQYNLLLSAYYLHSSLDLSTIDLYL